MFRLSHSSARNESPVHDVTKRTKRTKRANRDTFVNARDGDENSRAKLSQRSCRGEITMNLLSANVPACLERWFSPRPLLHTPLSEKHGELLILKLPNFHFLLRPRRHRVNTVMRPCSSCRAFCHSSDQSALAAGILRTTLGLTACEPDISP